MVFKATELRLDPETRTELEGWVRASTTEQRYVRRARIVLRLPTEWPPVRLHARSAS
jgi:hypothetical protein